MMPTAEQAQTKIPNIPSCICPACGAKDPETEFVDVPALICFETGYVDHPSGYRCLACGELSETEDWDRLAGSICCECGAVGKHVCPADVEDFLEQARRRGPDFDLPADFKFTTMTKEAA
jgi:hypothetical protein